MPRSRRLWLAALAKTNDGIIDDWQGFSNIDADNNFAMLAVLGYMHEWNSGHLFVGVRNVNEDFFTSDVTDGWIDNKVPYHLNPVAICCFVKSIKSEIFKRSVKHDMPGPSNLVAISSTV